jgi:4-aminobutyrate aminotransferase-like enzyme
MATRTRARSRTMHAWRPGSDAPVWERAQDELVRTVDGATMLDLVMDHGACLWGHGAIMERIMRRYDAAQLATGLGSTHSTALRERATDELVGWAQQSWNGPPDLVAGILHTGAEAVEAAVKTAIAATGRTVVVTFEGAYHGSFGVAAAATESDSARDEFEDTIDFEHWRREPYGSVPQLDDSVACVVAEPIQGASGVQVPPDGWLSALREECTRAGALLVLDDVLVGSGRTGHPLEGAPCDPDIVTIAKAIGGGVIGSAVLARSEVAEAAWEGDDAPTLSTTYYGHPLSCGAILEVLELHEREDLHGLADRVAQAVERAAVEAGLQARGRGAIWALDTGTKDGGTKLASALLDRNVIVTPTGTDSEAVMLLPSLRMSDESLDWLHEAIVATTLRA